MKLHKQLPKKIKRLVKQGAIFFVSHSGGKDSQAQYAYINKHVPTNQIIVIHSDLGKVEWTGVQKHINATIVHPLHVVVQNETKDFLEMVRLRGMFPSPLYRQCTNDLKVGPINKLIRKIMKEKESLLGVNCTGIRADESGPRKKKILAMVEETGLAMTYNKKLTIFDRNDCPEGNLDKKGRVKRLKDYTSPKAGKRIVHDWLPIADWTTNEVFQAIHAVGQRPHWAYEAGMTRLSCCFCIMGNKSDLRTSAKHNGVLLREIVALEVEIGHTMFMAKGAPIALDEYIGDFEEHQAPNLFELALEELEITESFAV